MSGDFWARVVTYLIEFFLIAIALVMWRIIIEIKLIMEMRREKKEWMKNSVAYKGGRMCKVLYAEMVESGQLEPEK